MHEDSKFFFFSSRRRHTILQGDWSSDVCSSDLCDGRRRKYEQLQQRENRWQRGNSFRGNHRSEERRVGKECRSRWSPYHYKNKNRPSTRRGVWGTSWPPRRRTRPRVPAWSGRPAPEKPYGILTCSLFFFQAEDGIRDYKVTGVQTCALPICLRARRGDGPVQLGRAIERTT